jgi:hypothetical protein
MKGALVALAVGQVASEKFVEGGNLKLNWKDCGDSSTHGKISGFSPSSLTLGQKTTATGTGSVDEAISGGTFDIAVKAGIISKSFNGDLCAPKTFDLPLGVGSVSWDGLKCPVAAGATSVSADINLSGSLPSSLAKAAITIKGQSSSGDKLLCMEIDTVPEVEEQKPEPEPVKEELVQGGISKLNVTDCFHHKSWSPSSLTLGRNTTFTYTGSVDEGFSGGEVDIEIITPTSTWHHAYVGDLCAPGTMHLPLKPPRAGSATWHGLKCPVAAGNTSVSIDINLSTSGDWPRGLYFGFDLFKYQRTAPGGRQQFMGLTLCMDPPEAEEQKIIVV